jgi:predicted amidohydrolase
MKIALAQIKSQKGAVSTNIQHHLLWIDRAAQAGCPLIVFRDLSVTIYEPDLAEELATTANDPIFIPFQLAANTKGIAISIGMPLASPTGNTIGMLVFRPHEPVYTYAKQRLHPDEIPFFVPGERSMPFQCNHLSIAWGICYETLHRQNFELAHQQKAELFIASVSKPDRSAQKAYIHFPTMAKEFSFPVLMVNAVGAADNFIANGGTAVWNAHGQLVAQLAQQEALLIYDHINSEVLILA